MHDVNDFTARFEIPMHDVNRLFGMKSAKIIVCILGRSTYRRSERDDVHTSDTFVSNKLRSSSDPAVIGPTLVNLFCPLNNFVPMHDVKSTFRHGLS